MMALLGHTRRDEGDGNARVDAESTRFPEKSRVAHKRRGRSKNTLDEIGTKAGRGVKSNAGKLGPAPWPICSSSGPPLRAPRAIEPRFQFRNGRHQFSFDVSISVCRPALPRHKDDIQPGRQPGPITTESFSNKSFYPISGVCFADLTTHGNSQTYFALSRRASINNEVMSNESMTASLNRKKFAPTT